MVALGVTAELIALPFELKDAADLNKEAADARLMASKANDRSSSNELARVVIEKQIIEITNNAAKADPRNQGIYDVSADVIFFADGTNLVANSRTDADGLIGVIGIGMTNWGLPPEEMAKMFFLTARKQKTDIFQERAQCSIHFEIESGMQLSILHSANNKTASEMLRDVGFLRFSPFALPINVTNIQGGLILLHVNAALTKTFTIPSGTSMPIIATNSY